MNFVQLQLFLKQLGNGSMNKLILLLVQREVTDKQEKKNARGNAFEIQFIKREKSTIPLFVLQSASVFSFLVLN